MNDLLIFNFSTRVSDKAIPTEINNPFDLNIPEIATQEFQDYLATESKNRVQFQDSKR